MNDRTSERPNEWPACPHVCLPQHQPVSESDERESVRALGRSAPRAPRARAGVRARVGSRGPRARERRPFRDLAGAAEREHGCADSRTSACADACVWHSAVPGGHRSGPHRSAPRGTPHERHQDARAILATRSADLDSEAKHG
jgi:hypothetical protein